MIEGYSQKQFLIFPDQAYQVFAYNLPQKILERLDHYDIQPITMPNVCFSEYFHILKKQNMGMQLCVKRTICINNTINGKLYVHIDTAK